MFSSVARLLLVCLSGSDCFLGVSREGHGCRAMLVLLDDDDSDENDDARDKFEKKCHCLLSGLYMRLDDA